MNFGRMNDNYLTPADDRDWDYFVDYCEENGLDPAVEDFDAWVEEQAELAAEADAERRIEMAAEYALFGDC